MNVNILVKEHWMKGYDWSEVPSAGKHNHMQTSLSRQAMMSRNADIAECLGGQNPEMQPIYQHSDGAG